MKEYALIKDGKVKNVIVADEAFVLKISSSYDEIVRVDELDEKPEPDDDRTGGEFIKKDRTPKDSNEKKALKDTLKDISKADDIDKLRAVVEDILKMVIALSK